MGTGRIEKCTGFDDLELASAIGWLAREDKIQFELRDSDPMHKKAYVYLMLNLYFKECPAFILFNLRFMSGISF